MEKKELILPKSELNLQSIFNYGPAGLRAEMIDYFEEYKIFQLITHNRVWRFQRIDDQRISYEVLGRFPGAEELGSDEEVLSDFFQLDVKMADLYVEWCQDDIFRREFYADRENLEGIRILKQDPLLVFVTACLFREITKQVVNGNLESFCKLYGDSIEIAVDGELRTFYNFPRYDQICQRLKNMEVDLDTFGMRGRSAKLVGVLRQIKNLGGIDWFMGLKDKNHKKARKRLMRINNVGPFIAECTCVYGFGMTKQIVGTTRLYDPISKFYLSYLPRGIIKGSGGLAYTKHMRKFLNGRFPNRTSWNANFWMTYQSVFIEKMTMTPARRTKKRRLNT